VVPPSATRRAQAAAAAAAAALPRRAPAVPWCRAPVPRRCRRCAPCRSRRCRREEGREEVRSPRRDAGTSRCGPGWLGNPGALRRQPDNIGFMALEAIANATASAVARRFAGVTRRAIAASARCCCCRHLHEESAAPSRGRALHKLPLSAITVIHDEIELPPGKVRVKIGGGMPATMAALDHRACAMTIVASASASAPGAKSSLQLRAGRFRKTSGPGRALIDILADNADLSCGRGFELSEQVHLRWLRRVSRVQQPIGRRRIKMVGPVPRLDTGTRKHDIRVMKNVTITLSEDLARGALEAASRTKLSRLLPTLGSALPDRRTRQACAAA